MVASTAHQATMRWTVRQLPVAVGQEWLSAVIRNLYVYQSRRYVMALMTAACMKTSRAAVEELALLGSCLPLQLAHSCWYTCGVWQLSELFH